MLVDVLMAVRSWESQTIAGGLRSYITKHGAKEGDGCNSAWRDLSTNINSIYFNTKS